MNEITLIIEQSDPVIFCGVNNSNINLLTNLFPKLKITSRGNIIKVAGEKIETDKFENLFKKLDSFSAYNNSLKENNIRDFFKGIKPIQITDKNLILHSIKGQPIYARTKNQQKLVKEYEKKDLVFAIGPAGSGKTYTAIALAVRALKNKEVRKIILTRPAVEAGEKLGFLPGDMKEKIDPYLQPLYDALEDMIPLNKLSEMVEKKIIEIAPLAFMRGRTLNDAIIILDEAQNTTTQQLKMFMTRLGMRGKMIITGDITQIDLPRNVHSGLVQGLNILKNVKGIGIIEFDKSDILRHKVVQRIIEAYEKFNKEKES